MASPQSNRKACQAEGFIKFRSGIIRGNFRLKTEPILGRVTVRSRSEHVSSRQAKTGQLSARPAECSPRPAPTGDLHPGDLVATAVVSTAGLFTRRAGRSQAVGHDQRELGETVTVYLGSRVQRGVSGCICRRLTQLFYSMIISILCSIARL